MTTISPEAKILTAINVLSMEPRDQGRVVNYVQWRSKQDFESVFHNPGFMQLYIQVKELARPEPNAYEIVHAAHSALSSRLGVDRRQRRAA